MRDTSAQLHGDSIVRQGELRQNRSFPDPKLSVESARKISPHRAAPISRITRVPFRLQGQSASFMGLLT
jgi:hypothetical protein